MQIAFSSAVLGLSPIQGVTASVLLTFSVGCAFELFPRGLEIMLIRLSFAFARFGPHPMPKWQELAGFQVAASAC